MRVDIGNALAETATPGIPRSALDRLDDRIAEAHDRIERGVAEEEFGYAALSLPSQVDLAEIRRTVTHIQEMETVLVVGIGGSALGASTITAALGDTDTAIHILDNVDPAATRSLLGDLDLSTTGLHVVSRSGTTAETMANFLVVRGAFRDAGVDWTDRTIVTTGPSGPLRELAEEGGLPVLEAPSQVPGRFSALSTIGLPAAVAAGVDVEQLVQGARDERASLTGSLYDCPAYAYGAVAYGLQQREVSVNAIMPYAEALDPFAEWVAQLWAESLGKEGLGQTPVRALGATDQHSQLQLYRAGPRSTMVSFIRPRERPEVSIPTPPTGALDYLSESTLGSLIDAEFEATEASLANAERPSVRVELPRLDAAGLGQLLLGFEAATMLVGELSDVPTFTQPAVEWGKEATREYLRGGTDRVDAVGEEFYIE